MSHQLASSSLIFLSFKPANQKIIAMLVILSCPSTSSLFSLSKTLSLRTLTLTRSHSPLSPVSINMNFPAFTCKPIMSKTQKPFSPNSAFKSLKTFLLGHTHEPCSPNFKVLPFRKGSPLAGSTGYRPLNWHLGWLSLSDCKLFLKNSEVNLSEESMVYVSAKSEDNVVYWAIDVSEANSLENELGSSQFCFIELRTLMVATDWSDPRAMDELAVAGHARALLEWHNISQFCGYCGERTVTVEAGRRKQCSNELCKKGIYPRVDPVVIMLVIDKENDRALLSRKSRYALRMWSCLAGFIEPGESLEEAVRRETWEETGIEVGEVIYHSSQPWPVGPSSMPCQLMVGFFAYAKSLEIKVDKEELEDAKWHNREDVKKALTFTEYEKAQRSAAAKVDQMCKGVEKVHNLSADYNMESGEFAPMFIPGPSAIAYHLISSWVYRDG